MVSKTVRWVLPVMMLVAGGCTSYGGRSQGSNFSEYLLSFYGDGAPRAPRTTPSFPVKLGVSELGQITVSDSMLDALKTQKGLFSLVESVPGLFDSVAEGQFVGGASCDRTGFEADVKRVHRLARDMGLDYLFVYGGSTRSDMRETPWSALDLTIVGAYVAPTNELKMDVQASGALIDLKTDRVLAIVTARKSGETATQTLLVGSNEGKLADELHAAVVPVLAQRLIDRCNLGMGTGNLAKLTQSPASRDETDNVRAPVQRNSIQEETAFWR